MTPLQFVNRQRITRAQQLIRETSRSLIEVGPDFQAFCSRQKIN